MAASAASLRMQECSLALLESCSGRNLDATMHRPLVAQPRRSPAPRRVPSGSKYVDRQLTWEHRGRRVDTPTPKGPCCVHPVMRLSVQSTNSTFVPVRTSRAPSVNLAWQRATTAAQLPTFWQQLHRSRFSWPCPAPVPPLIGPGEAWRAACRALDRCSRSGRPGFRLSPNRNEVDRRTAL